MTGSSQGPDWWRASDGMWYPPESHPDFGGRGGLATGTAVLARTTPAPGPATESPTGEPDAFTPLRLLELGALVLTVLGVFLPWATTDAAIFGLRVRPSVIGVDLGAGQILCGIVVVVLGCCWWHLSVANRWSGVALFAAWLAALGLTTYEMVDIIAMPTHGLLALDVGAGLYLCGFAALVASVCALTDLAQLPPARAGGAAMAGRASMSAGLLWVGAVAGVLVVTVASILGARAGVSPVGTIPTLVPDRPTPSGGGPGPTGGSTPPGTTPPGTTGPSGSSGGSGSTGSTGPSGATGSTGNSGAFGPGGNSGNSGPGGPLGNSGSGNSGDSGPGIFGNSGPGGLFGGDGFGNAGGT